MIELIPPTSELLNQVSSDVTFSELASKKYQDLLDSMVQLANGKGKGADTRQMVGLAAVQVGVLKNMILIDVTADGSNKQQTLQEFINPKITYASSAMLDGREECWSCGNICGNVARSETVSVSAVNKHFEPAEVVLNGFIARIAQHEIDHLNGIRFPDRIPADQPHRLHTVRPEEFELYRTNWHSWQNLCDRSVWDQLKSGIGPGF